MQTGLRPSSATPRSALTEYEGIAICAGLYAAGQRAVMMMQTRGCSFRGSFRCLVGTAYGLGLTSPELCSRQARTLGQRLEFRTCDLGVNAPAQTAVGARNHVFPTHDVGVRQKTVRNEFRMLHHIGGMAHDAGDDRPTK